jgi:glyoxylase-like metal-dependent hydrolase (beta-lactamase superfamily II)
MNHRSVAIASSFDREVASVYPGRLEASNRPSASTGYPSRVRVAEAWFEHETIDDGVIRITEPHVDPFLRSNLYLVRGRDRDLLVDSGNGIATLRTELADLFERPVVAVATHRHFDHVGGLHEFDEVVVHRDDAEAVARADGFASLRIEDYPPEELTGYERPESLLTAVPREGWDVASYRVEPVTPTRVVVEGDAVDLGDRRFEILHLPGHAPGEIGLWEAETATLFSGDCVYESGVLLDELPESNIPDYVASMERLRDVPARIVHGGHDDSFGRERLLELIDEYVARRG